MAAVGNSSDVVVVVCCRRWWWLVVDDGGWGTSIVHCLMMPNRGSAFAETQFGRGKHRFVY